MVESTKQPVVGPNARAAIVDAEEGEIRQGTGGVVVVVVDGGGGGGVGAADGEGKNDTEFGLDGAQMGVSEDMEIKASKDDAMVETNAAASKDATKEVVGGVA